MTHFTADVRIANDNGLVAADDTQIALSLLGLEQVVDCVQAGMHRHQSLELLFSLDRAVLVNWTVVVHNEEHRHDKYII